MCSPYWLYIILLNERSVLFNQNLSSFKPASLCSERNFCRFVPSTPKQNIRFLRTLDVTLEKASPPARPWGCSSSCSIRVLRSHLLGDGRVWYLGSMNVPLSGRYSNREKVETPGKRGYGKSKEN